jgi:hypothetical protein
MLGGLLLSLSSLYLPLILRLRKVVLSGVTQCEQRPMEWREGNPVVWRSVAQERKVNLVSGLLVP